MMTRKLTQDDLVRRRLEMWLACIVEGREWLGVEEGCYAFGHLPGDTDSTQRMPIGRPRVDQLSLGLEDGR